MEKAKFETVRLEDLNLFAHFIANKGMLPHLALDEMIKHNQTLDDTLKYLECMVDDIKKYQSNLGTLNQGER